MFCVKCGKQIPNGNDTCINCGHKLGEPISNENAVFETEDGEDAGNAASDIYSNMIRFVE